jgi:hypothetical protein
MDLACIPMQERFFCVLCRLRNSNIQSQIHSFQNNFLARKVKFLFGDSYRLLSSHLEELRDEYG